MDGVEAASQIRQDRDVPVIFLTAYSGDEILKRAMVTEPYAYLLKPIQEEQLATALRIVWYKHGKDSVRKQSAQRFSSILRALPNGLVVTDKELNVRYLNNRAKKMIGLTKKEVWGRWVGEVVLLEGGGIAKELREGLLHVLNGGAPITLGENWIRSHLGTSMRVTVDISAFTGRQGEIIGGLIVITEPTIATDVSADSFLFGTDEVEYHPPASELGQLRSFLEVEIIRLSLGEQSGDSYIRGFTDGQLSGNKRILQLVFGDKAVQEIDALVEEQ
jgi:PAS domain S-box-containing protein